MIRAICMLAGGRMSLLRGVYIDVVGQEHLKTTLDALVARDLAKQFTVGGVQRVSLTDPRGRWFSSTALACAADALVDAHRRKEEKEKGEQPWVL